MSIEVVMGTFSALSGVIVGAILQPLVNSVSYDREAKRHLDALCRRFTFYFINLTTDLETEGIIYEHNLRITEELCRKLIEEIPSNNSAEHAHFVAWELLNCALKQGEKSLRKHTYYQHAAQRFVDHYQWKKAKTINQIHKSLDEAAKAAHTDKLYEDLEGLEEDKSINSSRPII